MTISLRARIVYPVGRPPIDGGIVTIDGERIVDIGKTADGEIHDLGDIALIPGLVNAHTHLEFSYLNRPLGQPGMRLVDWIRLVIAERGRGEQSMGESLQSGVDELIANGVTTVADIVTQPICLPGTIEWTMFTEVIGFSRARAASAMHSVVERLNFLASASADSGGEDNCEARFGISPHAPYTVSPDLLRQLTQLANERNLPMAMHLAESIEELEFLQKGTGPFQELLDERSMWDFDAIPRRSRPLDYLRVLAGAPRALVIHGNYLNEEEHTFLAEHVDRMSLVYCPRTHAYFAHPPYPLAELLAGGVRVALGTDSRASDPDLNLLGVMQHAARAHPSIDPHDILRMGTFNGAEALGRAADSGTLATGKLANMAAVPLPAKTSGTPTEVLDELLTGTARVSAVWLRGKLLRSCAWPRPHAGS